MLNRVANLLRFHGKTTHKVNDLLDVNRWLVSRSFQYIRLVVEVRVLLAIDKRYSSRSILAVLQGLNKRDPTTIAT